MALTKDEIQQVRVALMDEFAAGQRDLLVFFIAALADRTDRRHYINSGKYTALDYRVVELERTEGLLGYQPNMVGAIIKRRHHVNVAVEMLNMALYEAHREGESPSLNLVVNESEPRRLQVVGWEDGE